MKKNKGFTLTELLAVIVIIAILSVAAISGYSTMTRNSKKKTYESKVGEIENAAIKFAKDANLRSSTTISVNKLVVEGYLQPDESTETGLASISNPVNNENMICNLVRITVNDDLYIAEYYENKKDCLIAEQEMLDLEINIKAKELNGNTIGNNIAIINNVANWTRTDVLLIVSSEEYTDFNSISYDFDGRTITKEKNTPVSTATNYVETDYDKIAIKDVLIMFNNEVTVTYNMNDGTIHSRTVVVRIDKEIPTARAVASNDVSTSSTRKVSLTLDDANGSGVKGFYVSKSSDFTGKPLIKDTSDKDSKEAGHGSFAGYNSHFYGEQGEYYIKVIDKVGNEYITEKIELSNFDPNANSCKITVTPLTGETPTYWTEDTEWYNKNIKVTTTSNNDISSMGLKYFYDVVNVGTNITNEKKLTKFFRPEGSNTKLIKSLSQSDESDLRDYYTAMKGLSDKTKDITHCKKTIGVDKTKPTATITCTDRNTYKKNHTIDISITDELSGFSDNSIKIGWSPDRTTPPTSWRDLNGTISADKKSVSFTTDANKTTGDPITGEYYLWIQGESISDKAYNYLNNTSTTYKIKYDNTPPTCTNSGGSNTWKKVNITIKGTCKDDHSGCKPGTNSGATTYDTDGNVYKLYNKDIESTNESPGTIYDKAGNHADCKKDQVVKRDTAKPNKPSLVMTHSYNKANAEGKKATVYTNNTWVNSSISTAVYMTDARYSTFRGPSATDSGTVQSGINRYQISLDNKSWSDYAYSYSGSDSLYTLLSNGTHNRYIRAIDNAGNISDATTLTIKIDKTPPTTPSLVMTHSYNSSAAQGSKATVYANNTWINKNVYMTDARKTPYSGLNGSSDSGSGLNRYEISSNNSTWTTYSYNSKNSLYLISAEGTNNRYIRAVDNAGNASSSTTLTIKIDKTPPTITSATYKYRSSIFTSPHDNTSCQIFPNDACAFTLNTGQKVYQLTSASKSACISSIRAQIQWGCGPANYTNGSINNSNTSINNTNYIYNLVSVNNGPSEIALKSVTVSDNNDSSPTTTIKKGGFNPDASSQTANTSYTLNSISTVDASNHGVVYRIRAEDDAGNVRTWDIIATHVGSNDVKANNFGETNDLMYFNKFIRVGETQFHKGWQQRYYIRTFYTGGGTNIEDITYLTFKSYYSDSTYKLEFNGKDYCPSQGCQIKGFKKIGGNWYYFNTNEVENNEVPNGGMVVRGHGQNGKEVCKNAYDYLLNHVNSNGWQCDDHNKPHTELKVDDNGVCASGHHP